MLLRVLLHSENYLRNAKYRFPKSGHRDGGRRASPGQFVAAIAPAGGYTLRFGAGDFNILEGGVCGGGEGNGAVNRINIPITSATNGCRDALDGFGCYKIPEPNVIEVR